MTQALNMELPPTFKVDVQTTDNRGFTPEEVAERCANRIVAVSDNAEPMVRAQAHAFKEEIQKTVVFYMKEAIKSDRTTVYNALIDAAQPELAELIRRL
tara:strand:- start:1577 stop:1873 length:297 start_codon:yes stop_codon:yes gene_type:complete